MDAEKPPQKDPVVGDHSLTRSSREGHAAKGRSRTGLLIGGTLTALLLAVLVTLIAPPGPPATSAPTPAITQPAAVQGVSPSAPGAQAKLGSPPLHIAYTGIDMNQDLLPLTPAPGPDSITPPDTLDAYWLTSYGSPGSADTTYIIGHSWQDRDTAFNHLSTRAKTGDRITVTTKTGPATYTVKTVTTENKNTLKNSRIWDKVPNRLILISCYTADLWGTNIIITADQIPGS